MLRLTQPDSIQPYLRDASQFSGRAEGVAFPENEKEVVDFLKEANAQKIPVTVSGGRTGLVGGAVPEGGWVLSTEKFSRLLEIKKDPAGKNSWARSEPGILLKEFRGTVEKQGLFYPPDPTGPKAFFGGTLATNASGPNSFKYGGTRRHIQRIRVALADGTVLDLRRGEIRAHREGMLEFPAVRKIRVPLPQYEMPKIKSAAGLFAAPGMDAVDLFIGSEGTLGVITEIEAALIPRPSSVLSFVVFFPTEETSWRFARKVRDENRGARTLEYFDAGSLEFLRPRFSSIPKEAKACLFIEEEILGTGPAAIEKWHRLFEEESALDQIWEGDTPAKQEEFRRFRSELPLAVKDFLAEHGQVKIGTDTSVPAARFEELMLFHRREVEKLGLANVTFGHIGESHVHLNLLPRNNEEAERGRALYPRLVEKAEALGGVFSAEHGVGKLKRAYLLKHYGEKGIREMRAVKDALDPNGILGPGNIFE